MNEQQQVQVQVQVQIPSEPEQHGGGDADTNDSAAASAPAEPAGYPFSVLRVLGTALRVTKRNFLSFFVLVCVLESPAVLLQVSDPDSDWLLVFVLDLVTNALTTAVVTYGVIMELHGSRPSTRACITTGSRQVGRVLGVSLVTTIAIFGAMLLLVVPGIIVALMLYVVVPVTLVEGLGVRAAMRRSRALVHGRKGDLFLIMLFGIAINIAIELVAFYELGAEAAFVWRTLGSALSTMFFAVTASVVYVELRKLREGTQVPELATAVARFRG